MGSHACFGLAECRQVLLGSGFGLPVSLAAASQQPGSIRQPHEDLDDL